MKTRIVPASLLRHSLRFDGSYHNAEMNIYADLIESHPHNILSNLCSEIFTSGRNKRVYTSSKFGNPFLSNSDVVAADPLASCNYSSKKYGTDERAMLKGGMILTGRVGAIGQTAYVPKFWEKYKAMGFDNIIRIVPMDNAQGGYIYAYLTSKIGTLALWKLATGGVQPFITDSMVGSLPIPKFPEEFQEEVDSLVQESARLREEAANALAKVKEFFDAHIYVEDKNRKSGSVSIKDIWASQNERFEATYHCSKGADLTRHIKENFEWEPLSAFFSEISRPDIFKRMYVAPGKGRMFLGSSEIFLANPKSSKFVSERTKDIDMLTIQEGWVLLPRSGTIGEVAYATSQHAQKLASEHVIRLKPDNILRGAYAYGFLSSNAGYNMLNSVIFGSVIQHIEPPMLKIIPVPVFKDNMEDIANLVIEANKILGNAGKLEDEAIQLVESEIEKWAK